MSCEKGLGSWCILLSVCEFRVCGGWGVGGVGLYVPPPYIILDKGVRDVERRGGGVESGEWRVEVQ